MPWIWLLAAAALAEEPVSAVGAIEMPMTPFEQFESYSGLLEVKGAGGSAWSSETPGFTCTGVGDWLEVKIERATWPSVIPKKVVCVSAAGKKKKLRVVIKGYHHEPMLVSDGTLLVPRDTKAAAIYLGPPPDSEVVVQQGKTGDLYIHCDIVAGPQLKVVVDAEAKDGVGYCTLRTKFGESVRVPIRIVSIK